MTVRRSFQDGEVEHIKEKWLYDRNNFIADVGGFLGLTLGASIISLFDSVFGVAWIRKKLEGTKK